MVMMINPLTYGLAALRRAMYWNDSAGSSGTMPGLTLSLAISLLFAVIMFGLASGIASARTRADLQ
jgi:hypothetical protein